MAAQKKKSKAAPPIKSKKKAPPAARKKKASAAKKKQPAKAPAVKKKKPKATVVTAKTSAPKPARKPRGMPPMHHHLDHPELDDEPHGDEVFEIFKTYDSNDSGSIDRAEFARLCEALGMRITEEEQAVALDAVDSNHSGRISWSEFKAWWNDR